MYKMNTCNYIKDDNQGRITEQTEAIKNVFFANLSCNLEFWREWGNMN